MPDLTRRRLSSRQTLWLKVLLPALWIPLVGGMTVWMWAARSAPSVPLPVKVLLLAGFVVGVVSLYWFAMRLKHVEIDDASLYVSGLRGGAVVALADVDEVVQNRWVNTRPITITFRRDTDAGSRVVFVPGRTRWLFWREDEVVQELRDAAARARSRTRSP